MCVCVGECVSPFLAKLPQPHSYILNVPNSDLFSLFLLASPGGHYTSSHNTVAVYFSLVLLLSRSPVVFLLIPPSPLRTCSILVENDVFLLVAARTSQRRACDKSGSSTSKRWSIWRGSRIVVIDALRDGDVGD